MNCLHSALIEVRNDPKPPTSDASVHSLTSNVIEFMLDLINVGHIVDNIEADYRESQIMFNINLRSFLIDDLFSRKSKF